MLIKRKPLQGDESIEGLAVEVLGWLAADRDRLLPFLSATGLSPDTLRASARDPAFLAGVLDHVVGDEAVLLACADALGVKPQRIAAAWRAQSPEPFDDLS